MDSIQISRDINFMFTMCMVDGSICPISLNMLKKMAWEDEILSFHSEQID